MTKTDENHHDGPTYFCAFKCPRLSECTDEYTKTCKSLTYVEYLSSLAISQTNALKVVANCQHIKEYLQKHDPKALQQCLDAIG